MQAIIGFKAYDNRSYWDPLPYRPPAVPAELVVVLRVELVVQRSAETAYLAGKVAAKSTPWATQSVSESSAS